MIIFQLTLDLVGLTPEMLDKMDLNPKYHLQLVEKGPDEPDEEFEEVFFISIT